ncbi:protein jade-3 [Stylonychia lemnae]|uniref:Protein jade-3 n=1 Tax=Stylonychia lemnae TaxID=5949 RepID=A0A078A5W4_STYLE|nr:protein jade-3 [Stylonychia lemnae]|eukprot:CDW77291.1 protein jade-3 [Stylonychia lemnae]
MSKPLCSPQKESKQKISSTRKSKDIRESIKQYIQPLLLDETEEITNKLKETHSYIVYQENENDQNIKCDICLQYCSEENDHLVVCELCLGAVHQSCYQIDLAAKVPEEAWFCQRCQYLVQLVKQKKANIESPKCLLCPDRKGIMIMQYSLAMLGSHILWKDNPQFIRISIVQIKSKKRLFKLKYKKQNDEETLLPQKRSKQGSQKSKQSKASSQKSSQKSITQKSSQNNKRNLKVLDKELQQELKNEIQQEIPQDYNQETQQQSQKFSQDQPKLESEEQEKQETIIIIKECEFQDRHIIEGREAQIESNQNEEEQIKEEALDGRVTMEQIQRYSEQSNQKVNSPKECIRENYFKNEHPSQPELKSYSTLGSHTQETLLKVEYPEIKLKLKTQNKKENDETIEPSIKNQNSTISNRKSIVELIKDYQSEQDQINKAYFEKIEKSVQIEKNFQNQQKLLNNEQIMRMLDQQGIRFPHDFQTQLQNYLVAIGLQTVLDNLKLNLQIQQPLIQSQQNLQCEMSRDPSMRERLTQIKKQESDTPNWSNASNKRKRGRCQAGKSPKSKIKQKEKEKLDQSQISARNSDNYYSVSQCKNLGVKTSRPRTPQTSYYQPDEDIRKYTKTKLNNLLDKLYFVDQEIFMLLNLTQKYVEDQNRIFTDRSIPYKRRDIENYIKKAFKMLKIYNEEERFYDLTRSVNLTKIFASQVGKNSPQVGDNMIWMRLLKKRCKPVEEPESSN